MDVALENYEHSNPKLGNQTGDSVIFGAWRGSEREPCQGDREAKKGTPRAMDRLERSGRWFAATAMLAERLGRCTKPVVQGLLGGEDTPDDAGSRTLRVLGLEAPGDISASLLRWALLGHWPDPLVDLAEALAEDPVPQSVLALEALCALGHTSGADLATGFLEALELPAQATLPARASGLRGRARG